MLLVFTGTTGKTIARTARVLIGAAVAPPLSLLIVFVLLWLMPGTEVTTHGTGATRATVTSFLFLWMIGSLVAYGATAVFGTMGYMILTETAKSDPRALTGIGAAAGVCTLLVISYEIGILSGSAVPWFALSGFIIGGLTGWLFWAIALRKAAP